MVEGPDWAAELEPAWRKLAEECAVATPFQTFEWQSAWMRQVGRSKRPYVWTCWEGTDLVGLMPLVRCAGPWRTLKPMGCGASDYLHPLSAPNYEASVADELLRHLKEETSADLVDLHQVRETEPLAASFEDSGWRGRSTLEQATCLVLDLPKTYDAFLSSLGKSLKYDVKRLDKLSAEGGRVRTRDVDPEDAGKAMEVFLDFHKRRWRKRGLPGAFVGKRIQAFHKEWAQAAARNGWLKMSLLTVDENPAGAIYAMALGQSCYFYQSGFDPRYSSLSPGTLLVAHTVRKSIEEGRTRFDFLRGDEPYKRRWKPQHEIKNLRLLAPTNGFLGRIAQAWNGAGFRVESRVRARLEGRGLN